MEILKKITKLETIIFSILFIILILTAYLGFFNSDYFNSVFAKEDGAIEYGTAIFLFSIVVLQFKRLILNSKNRTILWKIAVLFFGLIFLFGAGEEVSWGQRIFDIESSDFFKGNNLQKETNLHNLEVNGVKLNKVIFSQLITFIMAIYLFIIPILYKKYNRITTLIDKFAIPIPQTSHIIAFLTITLLILVLPNLSRKWEVYEFFFAVIFLMIFLNPVNKNIYLTKHKS